MKRHFWQVQFILALFFISLTAFWIFKNKLPPPWDQASYLEGSIFLFQSFTDGGIFKFLENSTIVLGSKAPLITILPTPLYLLFGTSAHVALVINLVFMAVFYIFFYKLVSLVFDRKIAIAASAIVSTMPLFYGLARYFYVEFGLMTFVVVWVYLILKTKNLSESKYLFYLGIVSGLGMFMKFHFFMFVLGPLFLVIWKAWQRVGTRIVDLKKIALILVPAFVIDGPWYFRNILTLLWKAKRSTNPELLGSLYYGPPLSLTNLYFSALDFINFAISPYWLFILLILLGLFIYRREKMMINYLFLSWFIVPFLLFYLGPNKDYRLMLPLLPPLAVLIAWLFLKIFSKKWFVAFAITMAFPLAIFTNTALFNGKLIANKILQGPFVLADERMGDYIGVPRDELWPIEQILESIVKTDGNKIKKVVLASEDEQININTLRYFSLLNRMPLDIKSGSYLPKNATLESLRQVIEDSEYIIIKAGGAEGSYDLNRFIYLIPQILEGAKWKKIPNDIELPDKGRIIVWQKNS